MESANLLNAPQFSPRGSKALKALGLSKLQYAFPQDAKMARWPANQTESKKFKSCARRKPSAAKISPEYRQQKSPRAQDSRRKYKTFEDGSHLNDRLSYRNSEKNKATQFLPV